MRDGATGIIIESRGGAGSVRGGNSAYSYPEVTVGGDAGLVSLDNAGQVRTEGAYATAALVQSVGGAGGIEDVSGGGRNGAHGGVGGEVRATNTGSIDTKGDYSLGVVAQSIGGPGGKGGIGSFGGGDGGVAAPGGLVTLVNDGLVETSGTASTALVGQSIGGGRALDAFRSASPAKTAGGGAGGAGGFLFFGSGGDGGEGADGGAVNVSSKGGLATVGDDSYGILAQSIGGGGGGGGVATPFGFVVSVALGGDGGVGGVGGSVDVVTSLNVNQSRPTIVTQGDRSAGILAQSIGGGGGAGGAARAATGGAILTVATAIGGSGSSGGSAGKVSVENGAVIDTHGGRSYGIQAMSIGGGGGDGGASLATAVGVTPDPRFPNIVIATAVGGRGATGSSGNNVSAINYGTIRTTGSDSIGILAMSVGGGGGAGGLSEVNTILLGRKETLSMSWSTAVGGDGASGSTGGGSYIRNHGQVLTKGDQASALAAYSIGGGGGFGGGADVKQEASGKGEALAENAAFGGTGGTGNVGGSTVVDNRGHLETSGFSSNGIHNLSLGGGGGSGGFGTVKTTTGLKLPGILASLPASLKAPSATTSVNLTVGGQGGSGGDGGGAITVNSGNILTYGSSSRAIFTQTIGGGGGVGATGDVGSATKVQINITVGGGGAAAGNGGNASVRNATGASLSTWGDESYAIHAQSVGGGGGSGGSSASNAGDSVVEALINNAVSSAFKSAVQTYLPKVASLLGMKPALKQTASVGIAIGGDGGAAGNGGEVGVVNAGALATYGNIATGIFAQSIGGGGGNGGAADISAGRLVNAKMYVGGNGAAAGDGGKVSVTQSGSVSTIGRASFGVFAQSVGGGGGSGGIGIDKSAFDPAETLSGLLSPQTLTQKTGGTAGANGMGGMISVSNFGEMTTSGSEAHGLIAQSIGGGGGTTITHYKDPNEVVALKSKVTESDRGILKEAGIDIDALLAKAQEASASAPAFGSNVNLELLLGGEDVVGDGGAIEVYHQGQIETVGVAAIGILAQSIGGGGGLVVSGASESLPVIATIGGQNGTSGEGGSVKILLSDAARVKTHGFGSYGILAQSIGGGGGYSGAANGIATTIADSGSHGSGSRIDIEVGKSTEVFTTGDQAHGVYAQSLGGGGGTATDVSGRSLASTSDARDDASGVGGNVSVRVQGKVVASGLGAYGIFVQSGVQARNGALTPLIDITDGSGSIDVSVDGDVSGGRGDGAAIRVDGGRYNNVTIGDHATVRADSNRAILGSYGLETVWNKGVLTGDVDLAINGSSSNDRLVNGSSDSATAVLRTNRDGMLNVGTYGKVINHGIFDVGGAGRVGKTTITGGFDQTLHGRLLIDVSPMAVGDAAHTDLIVVTGPVTLDGTVQPRVIGGLLPGQYTFLTADRIDGVSATARDTLIQSGSVPVSWEIVQSGNSLALSPTAQFASPRSVVLTHDQQEIADALQRAWDAGAIAQADVFSQFLSVRSKMGYANALDSIDRESSLMRATTRTQDMRAGLKRAMSCPAFVGTTTLLREGNCSWARTGAEFAKMGSTTDQSGYHLRSFTYQGGIQAEFSPDWFAGVSGAYTYARQRGADDANADRSHGGDISLALKHQSGSWLFATSTNFGYARQTGFRTIEVGEGRWTAHSKSNVLSIGSRLRASRQFVLNDWYVKPYADLDLLFSHSFAYAETGADGLNLNVKSMSKTLLAFSPNVELGGKIALGVGRWIRPFGTVGLTAMSSDHFTGRAAFQGNDRLGSFATTSHIPDRLGELGLGVHAALGKGIELTGEYQTRLGDGFTSHSATGRVAVRF